MMTVDEFLSEQPTDSQSAPPSIPMQSVDDFLSTPKSILSAKSEIGSQDNNGMCERFVEKHVYGKTGLFPRAIDAANYYAQNGQLNPDIQKAPAGSMVYFNADSSNEDAGHVAIYDGQGNIIGATDNGVKSMPVDAWMTMTKQQPLGFVSPQ